MGGGSSPSLFSKGLGEVGLHGVREWVMRLENGTREWGYGTSESRVGLENACGVQEGFKNECWGSRMGW